jgi:hypothetical protein
VHLTLFLILLLWKSLVILTFLAISSASIAGAYPVVSVLWLFSEITSSPLATLFGVPQVPLLGSLLFDIFSSEFRSVIT